MIRKLLSMFGAKSTASAEYVRVPPPADAESYERILAAVLATQSDRAKAQITAALAHLPPKVEGLDFGVHPDQDGEGCFSVMIHLTGPDLYVLNKAIAPYRKLFNVKRTATGLSAPVPLFDPDEAGFEVNEVIFDAACDWVETLWQDVGGKCPAISVSVFDADDFSTSKPCVLQRGVG